jgi:hypothetical protein
VDTSGATVTGAPWMSNIAMTFSALGEKNVRMRPLGVPVLSRTSEGVPLHRIVCPGTTSSMGWV